MKTFSLRRVPGVMLAALVFANGCATESLLWNPQQHEPDSLSRLALFPATTDILVSYDEKVSSIGWMRSRTERVQPKAYWLYAATNRAPGKAPAFVETAKISGGIPVPVIPLNLTQAITNCAQANWLRPGVFQYVSAFMPGRVNSIDAGTNAFGQRLYVTNAAPATDMFIRVARSPPRYVAIHAPPPQQGYAAAALDNQFALWRDGEAVGTFVLPTYVTHERTTWWRIVLTPILGVTETVGYLVLYSLPLVASGYANE